MYILSFLNRKENFQNSFKGSLRGRRKRGRGKEAKTWEKNGGLGASPTPSPPFFSRVLAPPSLFPFTSATQATLKATLFIHHKFLLG